MEGIRNNHSIAPAPAGQSKEQAAKNIRYYTQKVEKYTQGRSLAQVSREWLLDSGVKESAMPMIAINNDIDTWNRKIAKANVQLVRNRIALRKIEAAEAAEGKKQAPVRRNRKGRTMYTFSSDHTNEAKNIHHYSKMLQQQTRGRDLAIAIRDKALVRGNRSGAEMNQINKNIELFDMDIALINTEIVRNRRSLNDRRRHPGDRYYPDPALTRVEHANATAQAEQEKYIKAEQIEKYKAEQEKNDIPEQEKNVNKYIDLLEPTPEILELED